MDQTKYLIVGGGVASAKAAVAIREQDKDGRVVLVSREDRFPYDRPPLSKDFLQNDKMTPEDPESKDPSWYTANDVEIRKAWEAVKIDPSAHAVTFANGETVTYEKLLLTTGASPVEPDIPGLDLKNVFFLRTVDDAINIRNAIQLGGRAVMIGGGYIGLEVAASATARGVACTVIDSSKRIWSRFASQEAGEYVAAKFKSHGAHIIFDDHAARIQGEGKVSAVRTLSGQEFAADFVVVGVGATLNTELAKAAGLELDNVGAIVVDDLFRTSTPDVYAAGDVAAITDAFSGKRGHLEHYLNASWQGSAVGASMAGQGKPYAKVPYFYSDMFDIHMALRGTVGGELAQTFGDVNGGNFVEIYRGGDDVVQMGLAVSTEESKLDPISESLEALIQAGAKVSSIEPGAFPGIA